MGSDNFIKFLGTAGARFVVARQLRSSAGIFLKFQGKNIILDPGPGTIVRCAVSRPGVDVTKLDAIILTHAHIDHSNDVNILIDAMTNGGINKRGVLFAPGECLNGENAVVLKYLRGFLENVSVLEESCEYSLGDEKFRTSVRLAHPVETYGIKFNLRGMSISFITDTKFFPELASGFENSDILIINVVIFRPVKHPHIMHLCIDDVKELVLAIKPKKVFLTHFGMTMLKAKPWKVAEELTEELGVSIKAASDGMKVDL